MSPCADAADMASAKEFLLTIPVAKFENVPFDDA
jgi:hypothetical protein